MNLNFQPVMLTAEQAAALRQQLKLERSPAAAAPAAAGRQGRTQTASDNSANSTNPKRAKVDSALDDVEAARVFRPRSRTPPPAFRPPVRSMFGFFFQNH